MVTGVVVLAVLSALAAFAPVPAGAARPNGAGLVIRHGDGRIVYAYVEFTTPTITGDQLLIMSHVPLVETPYGGLGEAVCSLDGEGCPATNCFCKSYGISSVYWHYYHLNTGGTWGDTNIGPSSQVIHDGDVEGWSWTGGSSGLPPTSIDAIAKMNGVDRSASGQGTATTPTPTAAPPTPTPAPTPTTKPTEQPTSVPTRAAPSPTAPPVAPTAAAATAAATVTAAGSAVTIATSPPVAAATTAAAASPAATPVARAVEVSPNGTATPLVLATRAPANGPPTSTYLTFAGLLVALAGLCAWFLLRRRSGSGP
ncbi:MAG TPA: hypothetical protein VFN57_06080 [Thermomicrobiaceae bacterium]|nr:hypothetical protein [Thermomicrobiaceae bacterium]